MTSERVPIVSWLAADRRNAPKRDLTQADRTELRALTPEIVDHLRVANIMAGKDKGTIDFDLAPAHPHLRRFSTVIINEPSREEWQMLLGDLQGLQAGLDHIDMPAVTADDLIKGDRRTKQIMQINFLKSKLKAYEAFYLMKLGSKASFGEYLDATMGIEPVQIGESRLEIQRDRIEKRLRRAGYGGYSSESVHELRQRQLVEPGKVPDIMRSYADKYLDQLSRFLGRPVRPNYKIEFPEKPEDAYWFNWSDGVRGDFRLRVNDHPRHFHKFTSGKIEAMVVHEILGHFGQMYGWQQAIVRRELLEPLGVTSVFDPEQVASEGLAQSLHYFIPELYRSLSPEAILELEMEGFRQMVYNNVHIRVNEDRLDTRKIIRRVQAMVPTETEEEIKKQIAERTRNPIRRTYLYSYGIGFALHQWAGTSALSPAGRRKLMDYSLGQPMTPMQEIQLIDALSSDVRYAGESIVSFDEFLDPKQAA